MTATPAVQDNQSDEDKDEFEAEWQKLCEEYDDEEDQRITTTVADLRKVDVDHDSEKGSARAPPKQHSFRCKTDTSSNGTSSNSVPLQSAVAQCDSVPVSRQSSRLLQRTSSLGPFNNLRSPKQTEARSGVISHYIMDAFRDLDEPVPLFGRNEHPFIPNYQRRIVLGAVF
jgi:hypothetical protein